MHKCRIARSTQSRTDGPLGELVGRELECVLDGAVVGEEARVDGDREARLGEETRAVDGARERVRVPGLLLHEQRARRQERAHQCCVDQ